MQKLIEDEKHLGGGSRHH